jgi:hypothetical protein
MQSMFACLACVLVLASPLAQAQKSGGAPGANAISLNFRGVEYVHRWSKNGQNEFTPNGEIDLARWQNMITVNVHEAVGNGDQLADLANRVLANYQSNGKIIRTDSKPRTPQQPAEHVIVAVLGQPAFLEAAFARLVLVDDKGFVVVYSHRIYDQNAGPAMSDWLRANGPATENALMSWTGLPSVTALKKLPQSK